MRNLRGRDRGDPEESHRLRGRIRELEEHVAHLLDSEERLKILFENAPDGYYLSDLKGMFVDGNAAAETITGYGRGELIGRSFLTLRLLSSADARKAASLLARNLLGFSTGPDEFALTRKDGTVVPVEIRTHPVKIDGRRLVLGIARDISRRTQTERQLNERVKDLQAFYNLSESAETGGASLDAIYQDLADALPRSWQHADVACARITVGEREFRSSRY
ncbi:MAG: PAS domain S-box protein, partial [Candidatus Bipolaricaulia bacterium]